MTHPAIAHIQRRQHYADVRTFMHDGEWRFGDRGSRTEAIRAIYAQPIKVRRAGFLFLEGEPVKPQHFIVTTEDEGYLVSALKAPNQNKDSYVEVLVRPDHVMYNRIHDAASVLNIAGEQVEVPGVGESFQSGVYHIIVNDDEHQQLIGSAA